MNRGLMDFHYPGSISGLAYRIGFFGRPYILIQRHLRRMRFKEDGTEYWENCGLSEWKRAVRKDFVDLVLYEDQHS